MKILEEFWYGNIEPTEYDTSSCKEYKKLLELICRNEEKLKATMTDEQKELFEKYSDCVREYQTITDYSIWSNISIQLLCSGDPLCHYYTDNVLCRQGCEALSLYSELQGTKINGRKKVSSTC